MSVVAALLSIALFLAFASAGAQKIVFNPAMSAAADHLGFRKRTYQYIGGLEVLGAIALLVGLAAKGTSALALLNEIGAGGLFLMMALAVTFHLRKGDAAKYYTPALALGVLALVELVFRVA
jgi:uncharacterized membrane protein YphA (DoxX/SURF4 family)